MKIDKQDAMDVSVTISTILTIGCIGVGVALDCKELAAAGMLICLPAGFGISALLAAKPEEESNVHKTEVRRERTKSLEYEH